MNRDSNKHTILSCDLQVALVPVVSARLYQFLLCPVVVIPALVPVMSARWDPSRRMTAEQAAQHEWIKENTHRTRMSRAHPRRQAVLRSSDNNKTGGDPYMITSQAPLKGRHRFLSFKILFKSRL